MENTNKKISGLGFHHIALKANNIAISRKFYEEVMGMTPMVAWGEGDNEIQMFDLGDGGIFELFAGGSDELQACGKYQHFAMCVDDVDAAYATAIAGGARSHAEPKTVALDSRPYKMTLRIAFVLGPDDEQLELFTVVSKEK